MADLKTKYLGLELKSPIVVGACNLVADLDSLKRMEAAGAGAIVYKSLFEEQIQLEALEMEQGMEDYNDRHAEMTSLFPNLEHAGPKEHLFNFKKAKQALTIPLIASLNAVYDVTWVDYALELEKAGADALELNFYSVPRDFNANGKTIEDQQVAILKEIMDNVKIPVSVKLSPYYSNPLNLIKQMDETGVNGFVLFNRLFQPEIDITNEEHHFPWNLSTHGDARLSLRYAGLLHNRIKADIIANTGVLNGNDVIQMLLAGANSVQVVSSLYKNRIEVIAEMLADLKTWMDAKGYKSVSEFRGKLSDATMNDRFAYKRAQYVDILYNSKNIFETYPLR
ncbi:MAG TPA: dihydroorotate dehydrogenase [Bacteroidales bacterium]|nr:dihydroorotate dehydrogenase [Bacteroidales bacterium]